MEKEDVVESEYLKSLDNKTAQRYKEKIGIINNLDPYTLKRKELNENIEYTGKHFPKHPGTRPPHARLDRMKTRLRAKILLQIELSWNLV